MCGDVGGVSSKHIGAVTLQKSADWILDFIHTAPSHKGPYIKDVRTGRGEGVAQKQSY